ncbi:MAG: hypothetical protein ACR2GW_08875, partial [Pyrinomonadaceae bacterium]
MRNGRRALLTTLMFILVVALTLTTAYLPPTTTVEAAALDAEREAKSLTRYARPAPNFDLNLSRHVANARAATNDQLAAIEALRGSANASNMTMRWNDFGGSPDVLRDFASAPYAGTPEEAGRAFLAANAAAFGITNLADLRLVKNVDALGGHLVRFQQTFNGIDVKDGGIGLVMTADNRVIMASGPHFRDVNVNTQPSLTAEQAMQAAAADLARFHVTLPDSINNLLRPALDGLAQQCAVLDQYEPQLGVYPTTDGYKLVWKVAKFSTNP